jgi:hypothetical protein
MAFSARIGVRLREIHRAELERRARVLNVPLSEAVRVVLESALSLNDTPPVATSGASNENDDGVLCAPR